MHLKRSTSPHIEDRLWPRVDRSGDGCWEWQAYRSRAGYGTFTYMGEVRLAHRIAWMLTHGPIPEGMEVCHSCDNPACCRPDHLFLGTHRENMHDCLNKGRFHRGERTGGARLTEDDVRVIRTLYPQMNYTDIGKRYGVTIGTIKAIIVGKTWRHVV